MRMKLRAWSVLNAVRRPRTAPSFEADVICRMPIAGSENRNTCGSGLWYPSIKDGNNLVAPADREGPSGTEVVLHINDEERIPPPEHRSIVMEEGREAADYADYTD